jgi:maltodextrin utilization protein YvdJ
MRHQDDETPQMEYKSLVGVSVESKVSAKKIAEQMTPDDDSTAQELAIDFKENGGTIIETDGKDFRIEVDSGSFFIARNYVRRA